MNATSLRKNVKKKSINLHKTFTLRLMSGIPFQLLEELVKRENENSLRALKSIAGIDFSSNDYLGLAFSIPLQEKIKQAVSEASKQLGSTGSRLLTGNSSYTEELENTLANYFKGEAALLFNSGYSANTGLLSCIAKREDTIVYDQYCHASIRDGIKLSTSKSYGFKHNDLEDLSKKLANAKGNRYVVVESIYSMDGDFALLKEIETICKLNKALLIVDEAHSTGICGKNGEGYCVQEGIATFARVHTFGKAAGYHGACIIGSAKLKEYLINFSKPLIYTTALPPHAMVCIEECIKYLSNAGKEREQLMKNISLYNKEKGIIGLSPIKTILIEGNTEVKAFAKQLQEKGFSVFPILYPTVPEGKERIRICLHSQNTEEDIIELTKSLKTI